MKAFNVLALFHNWLCDKDFIWWPFSFLRPAPHECITFYQAWLMTLCFGGMTFIIFTVYAIMNNAFDLSAGVLTLISCLLSFFLWFNLITRPLWNRRARMLQQRPISK